jgi:hypothetical protein
MVNLWLTYEKEANRDMPAQEFLIDVQRAIYRVNLHIWRSCFLPSKQMLLALFCLQTLDTEACC